MASRLAVMDLGRIVQVGTPHEVYERPRSRFVADFIGDVNLIEGGLASVEGKRAVIESPAGRLVAQHAGDAKPGSRVWLAVRPEKVSLSAERPAAAENCVGGQVTGVGYLGEVSIYHVRLSTGLTMKVSVANATRWPSHAIGTSDQVWLTWAPDAGVVLTQ